MNITTCARRLNEFSVADVDADMVGSARPRVRKKTKSPLSRSTGRASRRWYISLAVRGMWILTGPYRRNRPARCSQTRCAARCRPSDRVYPTGPSVYSSRYFALLHPDLVGVGDR